jgi:NDP-sugar pyrophosphorylase family protein
MSTRFEGVMKAVILAGGQGTRLLPYTASLPKAMMPIGNRPILEVVVRQLHALGVEEILLATGYLEELIRSYFGDGSRFGVPIRLFARGRAAGHGRSAESGARAPDRGVSRDQ